jgi:hypothetical protein
MVQARSRDEFIQQASLSQQLSSLFKEFQDYAGADQELSIKISRLKMFIKHGYLDGKDPNVILLMDLLDAERKAAFASSDKVNEITKMGLMMPKTLTQYEGAEDIEDIEEIKDE